MADVLSLLQRYLQRPGSGDFGSPEAAMAPEAGQAPPYGSPLNQLLSPAAMAKPEPLPAVPEVAQPFLAAISSGESPSYNIRYDGGRGTTFDSFDDHPRQLERITAGPYRGQFSDAAGKYQMISTTWDRYAKKYGVPDFSPESQDVVAWRLANDAYGRATRGGDLLADLQAGKHADVARGLSSEWASIARDPRRFVSTLSNLYPPTAGGR